MEWVERLNKAIGYVEEHLTEEIAYSELAKIACCSAYHFQRMFAYMADVPLSEYIRRRRLTLAAFELQNSNRKVIDIALKYNYDSPEAFARAFQNMHGATPTAARNPGTQLKTYPRISFQISIKGAAEMNYRLEELPGFSIVGMLERVGTDNAFSTVPRIWRDARDGGVFEELWEIRDPIHPLRGILGVCANGGWGKNEEFDYIIAVVTDQKPRSDQVKLDFPHALWVVFDVPGSPNGIQEIWRRLYTEWLPTSSYELAYLPAIECYLPIAEDRNELWIPVVKKQ